MESSKGGEGPGYVLAAGGLLERDVGDGLEIAIVHRTRYRDRDGGEGDWVLPKGKLEPGESLEDTALREVLEETGCKGRIVGPSFSTEHDAGGVPKVTTFFRMTCEEPGAPRDTGEVREVLWLAPARARLRLTYPGERALVELAYPERSTGEREP